MRVTQTMLSNNSLRHISNNYQNLGRIQDQLATGKKISRASQDPVVAMNGMRYRTQVTEVEQFKRNIGEVYNWMDTADATLDKATQTLHRVRELTVQAANDTYDSTQRNNIGKEISQLKDHLISLANTKANNKFIFNGTNTTNQPVDPEKLTVHIDDPDFLTALKDGAEKYEVIYEGESYFYDRENTTFKNSSEKEIEIIINDDGSSMNFKANDIEKGLHASEFSIAHKDAVSVNHENVEIELLKGVNVPVNIRPQNVFSNKLFSDLTRLEQALANPTTSAETLTAQIGQISKHIDNLVNERADLGARYNRVEMIESRIMEQEVIAQRILSDNEDADMEKVIIELMSQEAVHRAALSAGARIIQPTLMDFLR